MAGIESSHHEVINGYSVDRVFNSYVETALWATSDRNAIPLIEWHGPEDVANNALTKMRAVVEDFWADHAAQLHQAELMPEQVGQNLWLAQGQHGSGFWNLGIGDVGNQLIRAAQSCSPIDIAGAIKPESRAWFQQQQQAEGEKRNALAL